MGKLKYQSYDVWMDFPYGCSGTQFCDVTTSLVSAAVVTNFGEPLSVQLLHRFHFVKLM
jgi:hypothetical protein